MDVWKCELWKSFYEECSPRHRTGAWLKFDKGVDMRVRVACKEFVAWLRKRYFFPIRVPIYIKASKQVKAQDGEMVSATCFLPWDRHVEPYIRVSAGDYEDLQETRGQDNALAMILNSIAHELTHYFQWVNDLTVSDADVEKQAAAHSNRVLKEYTRTRSHP